MPIKAVTMAISELLRSALNPDPMLMPQEPNVYVGPPDVNNSDNPGELILFAMRITPSPDLRNADRIRPFPLPGDPTRTVTPAVPLDVHYLVTAGSPLNGKPEEGLQRLGLAIRAIEAMSPIVIPDLYQTVWLSLEPLSTDELSRIWGLFPNFNCRTCFVFCASPVWIDPEHIVEPAAPVIFDRSVHGEAGRA